MGTVVRASVLFAALAIVAIAAPPMSADTVVRAGSASISNDPDAGTWTIRSDGTSLTLGFDASHDFRIVRLASSSGEPRSFGSVDTQITVNGKTLPFGSRAAGFIFQNATPSVEGFTVRLDVTYNLPALKLATTRHYVAATGSPTFETWTTFAPLGSGVSLSDLNAFTLTIPPGTVHWLNGLQGDGAEEAHDSAFTLQERSLDPGERLVLGASGRSSEQTVPWFAVDNDPDVFYAALLWSGAWSLVATRTAAGLDLRLGLGSMSTSLTSTIDGPHAVFGVTEGGIAHASAALRTYVLAGLRSRRPFDMQVTYNTWFAYGVAIDEESMRAEIDGAAQMGAERFVVDAGWYVGAGRDGTGDFSSGLGSYQVDARRFPSGLGALSDYAHERGLTFGLWVEPERVAFSTVGRPGLAQETWLAKTGGKYGSSEFAQVCFGSPAARQWVFDRLTALIDASRPDYLKWDNNFWINCDRSGHVHGASDGNFAHVRGVYDVLANLRERYPNLVIENVSGGGNRLDLGMLRYSDVGWMDDRTTPSAKVRHNIEGLSALFPPAYLLSFVMPDADEPLSGAADLPLIFRSRMPGVLGLCFRTGDFDEDEAAGMRRFVETYKSLRETTLRTAAGAVLTPQASPEGGPAWDVFQTSPEGLRPTIVWAFQNDGAARHIVIRPVGLRGPLLYDVSSRYGGSLGILSGSELMTDGVELIESPESAAHTLTITPVRQR